jgi:polar amino acid transport system ATP-binding protein/sulfate transport system ATP-binding protein
MGTEILTDYKYAENETLLSVEKVDLTLNGNVILRDVNCEIKNITRPDKASQGQIVGLLAPSGMGKTKLFEIISGIRKPTSGIVKVGETQSPVEQGMVGVLQQSYPLFRHRNIMKNLSIATKKGFPNLSRKERNEKIMSILSSFGLTEKKDSYPSQLSGGQRQRIAIAQQMLCSESLLLFDEPFSGLDCLMVDECLRLIKRVSDMNDRNTVVLVSHDISAIVSICDHVWIMGRDRNEEGKVIPGARIKYNLNLIDEGLAWRPEPEKLSRFIEVVNYIKYQIFPTL